MEEQFEFIQEELRKNKQKIGEVFNIALEVGGDLADQLLNVMNNN